MHNGMNGVNVADKLGLGPEVRELKFGSSFTSGGRGQQQGSFHSVRYDFKPASVDTSKMATLDVGPNGQVTISMPNVDGNGTTVFKGARKPYAKECVLIIDNETGEVVLEKLTHNIQVKRTREEGGSKKGGGSLSMPVVPPPAPEVKKAPQPQPSTSYKQDSNSKVNSRDREDSRKLLSSASASSSSSQAHHQLSQNSKRGPSNSPKPPHQLQKQSPNSGPSPGRSASPPPPNISPSSVSMQQDSHRPSKHSSQSQQQQQPNILSLTNFEDLLSMPMNPPAAPKPNNSDKSLHKDSSSSGNTIPVKPAGGSGNAKNLAASALSESSSGEDSSSSSSSEDDDDDSSDMEEVLDKVPVPLPVAVPESKSPNLGNRIRPPTQPVAAPSMPTDLLCEDLQLSESGSDSD